MDYTGCGDVSKLPNREQVASLLRYIPVFEDPGFRAVLRYSSNEAGETYPIWADEVRQFYREINYDRFLLEYDMPDLQRELRRYVDDPSLLAGIDLQTICRLFAAHLQRETFQEGHFPEMVACGHMAALLRRLAEIPEEQIPPC
jgi:hypothetical protein